MPSYASRRRSESMRGADPVQTPATDACHVYRQQWRRFDGQTRTFDVLATDEAQAKQFGQMRLGYRYNEYVDDWELRGQTKLDRLTSLVTAILTTETPEEDRLREESWFASHGRRAAL